ncbi:MAG: bacterial Ig-like domain-containing protein [Treponema sp.]|nr:bacterial Ig-like domain-containing protein [Treponema sp.]
MKKHAYGIPIVLLGFALLAAGCEQSLNGEEPESPELVSLEIIQPPRKTTYKLREDLDIRGLAVNARYSDFTAAPVPPEELEISGFDSLVPGEKTLILMARGKTVTLTVAVIRGGGVFDAAGTPLFLGGLVSSFRWIRNNYQENGNYTVAADGDASLEPQFLTYNDRTVAITLIGEGSKNPEIQLSRSGSLFWISDGVTLTLKNITLRGLADNTDYLVKIQAQDSERKAKLVMEEGALITGNTGGGVEGDHGEFIMNGGIISNNVLYPDPGAGYGAGGVLMRSDSVFTLNEGAITDNRIESINGPDALGGGVTITWESVFTMKGGRISGNAGLMETSATDRKYAWARGGGVYIVTSDFIMEGGIISGNTLSVRNATSITGTATAWAEGAGVYLFLHDDNYFTFTGGIIYGADEPGKDAGGRPLANKCLLAESGNGEAGVVAGDAIYYSKAGGTVWYENDTYVPD